tara:strand:- start:2289 stop:2588 length:300 start_codon:yes stop_codon:yes gene_type:complete
MKRGTKPHHNPKSKSTAILKHLVSGKALTSVDAFKDFYTTRLSAVIKNFRDLGYKIESNYKPNSKLAIYSMNPNDDGINVKLWDERYHQSQSVKAKGVK